MPWCPKCKNEYREGFHVCAECKCELVDELPITQEDIQNIDFMDVADIPIEKEEFVEQELTAKEILEGLSDEEKQALAARTKPQAPYRDSKERAEDHKSSAWTLLIVGIAGLIFLALARVGVIPINLSGSSGLLIVMVMSVVFILFIVMGAVSMKSFRSFSKKAESENNLKSTMKEWCLSNLNGKELDIKYQVDASEEEEFKYFKRMEGLNKEVSNKFMNLDEAFLEAFLDEIYEVIYSE